MPINILSVNKFEKDINALNIVFSTIKKAQFNVEWKTTAEDALDYLSKESVVDIILIEEYLPGITGLELVQKIDDLKKEIPVIFLMENNDINLAVEVMRLGVKDCLLKSEIFNKVFTQSLLQIVEKDRLKKEILELEFKQKRLEAMQEIILSISEKISQPLDEMNRILDALKQDKIPEKEEKFLHLIRENIERMQDKLEKLRNLKEDKTVKYIRDIRMIDLS